MRLGLFAGFSISLLTAASPASALNWEGHEGAWFHDDTPFQAFIEGVPPPLVKPLPSCAEVARKYDKNRYEQLPLPGKNCIADKDAPDQSQ